MRAGELCGLRIEGLELQRGLVLVRQSAWRGTTASGGTQPDSPENYARAPVYGSRQIVPLACEGQCGESGVYSSS